MNTIYKDRSRIFGNCQRTVSEEDAKQNRILRGVQPLSRQLRKAANGGLTVGKRDLSDSNYDEDSVDSVDPSSAFGSDRFERAEAIASQISERMQRKHRDKLENPE